MPEGWQDHPQGRRGTGGKLTEALLWRTRYSAAELEYLQRKGAPELAAMPEPQSWFFWQAYHHLRGSRGSGLALMAIPFSEIMGYAEFCGITCPVERSRLVRMVMEMDNTERAALPRNKVG